MRLFVPIAIASCIAGAAIIPAAHSQSPQTAMAIAADLGVGLDELVACTQDAQGPVEAPKGTDERKAAVRTLVLSCLQETRPDLTADQFNAVMAKYRP
jgi:hypothetical protein